MDKRIEKTKRALYDAFFQLRAKKSIREIKIAELCQAANINKTTFYSHYRDIYELAEDVEKQLLHKIIQSLPQDKEYTFENAAEYTKDVTLAFGRHHNELAILFQGSEFTHLSLYLEQVLKQSIFAHHPHLRNNAEMNVMLSYCIHGAFNAQVSNRNVPMEQILATLGKILDALQPLFVNF